MTRRIYATFDAEGFPIGYYPDDWHGPRMRPVYGEPPEPMLDDPNPARPIIGEEPNPDTTIPTEAIEISEAQYAELIENPFRRRWVNGEVVAYDPPPPPAPLIVLSADLLFFERMTDDEYDDLDASVRAGETARVYRGWAAATSFTEGTDLWALLVKHLDLTVTAARRDELLTRP